MSERLGPSWKVRRTAGVLPPGFSKRFDPAAACGTTYLLGVPVGRFDVVRRADGSCELRYLRWPVVDVLAAVPEREGGSIRASGTIRLPGGRRVRFCSFRLER